MRIVVRRCQRTGEELRELLFQFDSSVKGLPGLLLTQTLVHLSGDTHEAHEVEA